MLTLLKDPHPRLKIFWDGGKEDVCFETQKVGFLEKLATDAEDCEAVAVLRITCDEPRVCFTYVVKMSNNGHSTPHNVT